MTAYRGEAQAPSHVKRRGTGPQSGNERCRRKGRGKSPGLLATVSDEETGLSSVLRWANKYASYRGL